MKITAAVVHERSGPFNVEQLDLCDPRNDELLVEVVASGMCATDLHGRDAYYPTKFPKVFGHEGAGIVCAVGNAVTKFRPGDHVVMAYPWCGECQNCKSQRPSYCLHAFDLKMNGTRADGSTLHSKDGKPVYSAFFQQSSFGNFTIANERYAVKVRNDAPIEHVCALACGGQTGAGAVLNVMKPRGGDSFVVFGVGAVGLSGLMSAKIAGCDPIIAIDVHEHRLALARTLGATHIINHANRTDVVDEIRRAGLQGHADEVSGAAPGVRFRGRAQLICHGDCVGEPSGADDIADGIEQLENEALPVLKQDNTLRRFGLFVTSEEEKTAWSFLLTINGLFVGMVRHFLCRFLLIFWLN